MPLRPRARVTARQPRNAAAEYNRQANRTGINGSAGAGRERPPGPTRSLKIDVVATGDTAPFAKLASNKNPLHLVGASPDRCAGHRAA